MDSWREKLTLLGSDWELSCFKLSTNNVFLMHETAHADFGVDAVLIPVSTSLYPQYWVLLLHKYLKFKYMCLYMIFDLDTLILENRLAESSQ